MNRAVALLMCQLVVARAVASADVLTKTPPASPTFAHAGAAAGPLLRAAIRDGSRLKVRADVRQVPQPHRSWVKKHPVWTGAMVGFAAGFLITVASGDDHAIVSPAAAGLVFGGVGAGLGALAGWGISRASGGAGVLRPRPTGPSDPRIRVEPGS